MYHFDALRVLLTASVLLFTAVTDIKTRQAPDWAWVLLGGVGLGMAGIEMASAGWPRVYFLLLVAVAILFFDVFSDREDIYDSESKKISWSPLLYHLLVLAIVAYALYDQGADRRLAVPLGMLAMIVAGYIFYVTGVAHGGADAKAFMALGIITASYLTLGTFPLMETPTILQLVFPPVMAVLLNSAVIAMLLPFALLFYNASKKDLRFPHMFLGYKIDVKKPKKGFVWPMETMEDGKLTTRLFPRGDINCDQEFKKLAEAKMETTWVTPKIPFLVPMFLGYLTMVFMGNLLLVLFLL